MLILIVCSTECKIVFRGPRSLGYGFVSFEKESDAQKALTILKGTELDGRILKVEPASPRAPREERPEGERRTDNRRGRGRGRGRGRRQRTIPEGEPSKTTIFVGNLPFEAVDEDLVNIFSGYSVLEARILRRHDGASRGFGFVTLSEEEQPKAIEALAGCICDERRLVIRAALSDPAKKKEEEGEEAAEVPSA